MAESPFDPNNNQQNPGSNPTTPGPTDPAPTNIAPNPPAPMPTPEPTPDPLPQPPKADPAPAPIPSASAPMPTPEPPVVQAPETPAMTTEPQSAPLAGPTPEMDKPQQPMPNPPQGGELSTPWDSPAESLAPPAPPPSDLSSTGEAVGPAWLRNSNAGSTPVQNSEVPQISPSAPVQDTPAPGPLPWQAPTDDTSFSADLPEEHKGGGFPVIVFVVIILGIIVAVGAFLFTQGAFGG